MALLLKRGKAGVQLLSQGATALLTLRQDLPLPVEILSVMGRVAIGDEPAYELLSDVRDPANAHVPFKRGKIGVQLRQADSQGLITLRQDLPLPVEILNVLGRVNIGDEPAYKLFPELLEKNCPVPPPPPVGCPPDTFPGPQTLADSFCWQYLTGIPPGTLNGNVAGGLHYLEGNDPTFYVSVANRSAFGTDYATNTCTGGPLVGVSPMFQILKMVGANITAVTPVPLLNPADELIVFTQSAQWGQQGKADVHCYYTSRAYYGPAAGGIVVVNALFNITDQTIAYFTNPVDAFRGYWCKLGDFYYLAKGGANPHGVSKWQVSTGIGNPTSSSFNPPIWSDRGPLTPSGNRLYDGIQATANFLYVWSYQLPDGSVIYRLSHDGTLIESWTLDFTSIIGPGVPLGHEIFQIEVVSDNLIYIAKGNPFDINFWTFATSDGTLTKVGDTSTISGWVGTCTGANPDYIHLGDNALRFHQGKWYVSAGGAGSGLTNVESFGTVLCPPDFVDPIGTS